MAITDSLVLPADTIVVPVKELSEEVRRQVQAEDNDYAVTRPHSRTPSRIVDIDSAELLREFRKPTTVVQAVLRFSKARKADPEQTLEDAFPMIERLVRARLLVEADSEEARRIRPLFEAGAKFAGSEILSCIQALEDTDLYRVKTAGDETAALKVLRPGARADIARMFDRETCVLERLDGSGVSPKLLRSGVEDERRYLLIEWCPGVDCASAAAELRNLGAREGLLKLCGAILEAYSQLHARNVIHSDIHPRNVIAGESQSVRIVDFGLARVSGIENEFRHAHRGGVGFFFEPEYAQAARQEHRPPASTKWGEQYALAALLYSLIAGKHYLDFSLEKDEMFRQIAEDRPLPFSERGLEPWPELEKILAKALAKAPADRFASVGEFAEQLRSVTVPAPAGPPPAMAATEPASYAGAEEILGNLLRRFEANGPLFANGLKTAPRISVTYGSAGIAYGLYRVACAREDAELLSLADLWAARASRESASPDAFYSSEIEITQEVVGRISPYHTESGIRVVQGLIGHAMVDVLAQQSAIDGFVAAVTAANCDNLDVTLGQSGALLAASFLVETLSGNVLVDTSRLATFGNGLFDRIRAEIESYPPIRECRQIRYSGVAHGWAGILYAMLRWHQAARAALPSWFEERLGQLARLAEHVGRAARWNWTIGSHPRGEAGNYVAGWCNGSAGHVHLWTLAHEVLKDERYLLLAEKSAWHAWESDSQIGNLCCGLSGQAYALLKLHQHTAEKAWLHRAQAQAQKAAIAIREMAPGNGYEQLVQRAESLYKGELGVAALAADLENPEFAIMPFFG